MTIHPRNGARKFCVILLVSGLKRHHYWPVSHSAATVNDPSENTLPFDVFIDFRD